VTAKLTQIVKFPQNSAKFQNPNVRKNPPGGESQNKFDAFFLEMKREEKSGDFVI
jgi:hypothetical protein